MLVWSDLFNYILADTPFVVWKQLIVAGAWLYAIRIDLRSKKYYRSILAGFATLILIAWSMVMCNVYVDIAVFNSFLYFSWVPVFVILSENKDDIVVAAKRYQYYALFLFVASIFGLYIDWYTDYFNWVEKQVSSVSLLESIGTARRASFFFIASTMVIPLVAAPGIIFYLANPSNSRGALISTGLLLAVLPTGSGSSMVVAAICCVGLFVAGGSVHLVRSFLAMSLVLAIIFFGSNFSDNRTQLQMERLFTAVDSETESNVGRVDFWQIAMNDISAMSGAELILGNGLGVTNDNKGNIALYSHGESSFFQAMIEAGIVGVFSRLLPFALIFSFFILNFRVRALREIRSHLVVIFWAAASLLAIATAPTFGNIPFQAVLGFMLAALATHWSASDKVI